MFALPFTLSAPRWALCSALVASLGCDTTPTDPGLPHAAARACYYGPPSTAGVGECRAGLEPLLPKTFGASAGLCVGQVLPRAETCNGLDDDCNGLVDDGDACPSPCYTGPQDTEGVGVCRAGVRLGRLPLSSGEDEGACHGEVLPRAETCNGLDDDCNGVVDDGDVCPTSCYSGPPETEGVGTCRAGVRLGLDPYGADPTAACHGEVLPKPEICNGLDDDCDGVVDNVITGMCGDDALGAGGAGVDSSEVLETWLPDRSGPAHLVHRHSGALAVCLPEDTPTTCAERYLHQPALAARFGLVPGTHRTLEPAGEIPVPLAELAVVRFEQRHRGVPVEQGQVRVSVALDPPMRVAAVSSLLRPVPVSLAVHPTRFPGDLELDEELAADAAQLVVWVSYAGPQGQTLPAEEQVSALAWRWQGREIVFYDAHTGASLQRVSAIDEDVTGLDVSNQQTLSAMCHAVQQTLQCPLPQAAQPPTMLQAAVIAAQRLHHWLWTLVGRDGLDGKGDRGSGALGVWVASSGSVIAWDPCLQDPASAGSVLGWSAHGYDIVLCSVITSVEVGYGTALHEALHALHRHLGPDSLRTLEKEATEHAYVESGVSLIDCADPAAPVDRGCTFSAVDTGRKYDGAPIDPSHLHGCCQQVWGVNHCAAAQPIEASSGANVSPAFALCESLDTAPTHMYNRLALGNVFVNAMCRMAGCSPSQCTAGQVATCASEAALRSASERMLRLMWSTMPQQSGWLHIEVAEKMLATAHHLRHIGRLSTDDVAALHGALAEVGLASHQFTLPFEICDGVDNDGDGFVDNAPGTAAHYTLRRACYDAPLWHTGYGACAQGTEACHPEGWSGICEDQVLPAPEVCNGLDDDCDGQTDEGLLVKHGYDGDGDGYIGSAPPQWACPGSLDESWMPVSPATLGDCDDTNPAVNPGADEDCTTPWDDNCDGIINEGCPCTPFAPPLYCGPTFLGGACLGKPFGTEGCAASIAGSPSCSLGLTTCEQSALGGWAWADTCQGANFGSPEVCNGLDDDCDGLIDNDVAGLAPYCGPHGSGHEACVNGSITCVGAATPNACGGLQPLEAQPGDACEATLGYEGVVVCAHPNAVECIPLPSGGCVGGPVVMSLGGMTFALEMPSSSYVNLHPSPSKDGHFNTPKHQTAVDLYMTLEIHAGVVRASAVAYVEELGHDYSIGKGAGVGAVTDPLPDGCKILATTLPTSVASSVILPKGSMPSVPWHSADPMFSESRVEFSNYQGFKENSLNNGLFIHGTYSHHAAMVYCCSLPSWYDTP